MKTSSLKDSRGFSFGLIIVLVGIVVIAGLLAYTAYTQYGAQLSNNTNSANTTSSTTASVAEAPTIASGADLDKALSVLNDSDVDSTSDNATLTKQSNF